MTDFVNSSCPLKARDKYYPSKTALPLDNAPQQVLVSEAATFVNDGISDADNFSAPPTASTATPETALDTNRKSQRCRTACRSARWRTILRHLDPFLDVASILTFRQVNHLFHKHHYAPHNGALDFSGFRGYEGRKISLASELAVKSLNFKHSATISLRLSECSLLQDIHLEAMIGNLHKVHHLHSLRVVDLDFCRWLTDAGLLVLLTNHMPSLVSLSLNCCSNVNLTGRPFTTHFSAQRWPCFSSFSCRFTKMLAEFVNCLGTQMDELAQERGRTCSLYIAGSLASKGLLESTSFARYSHLLVRGLKQARIDLVARITKKAQAEWKELTRRLLSRNNGRQPDNDTDNVRYRTLLAATEDSGSALLVNCPFTAVDADGVDVWTLPLSLVAKSRNIAMTQLLLKRQATVDCWDFAGVSPLVHACVGKDAEMVQLLLENGAHVSSHNATGRSPLHIAAACGDLVTCELLLSHGVDLNESAPDERKYKSPLYVACENCSWDVVRLMLKNRADPNWSPSHVKCSPALVAYRKDRSILQAFMEGPVPMEHWVMAKLLFCAIDRGDGGTVHALVRAQPNILQWKSSKGSFVEAARMGNASLLEFLCRNGDVIHSSLEDGTTALHAAVVEGSLECVQLLLAHGALPNHQNKTGLTAVHLACIERSMDILKYLLENGGDANVQDFERKETCLMICIRLRHLLTANLLLKHASNLEADTADAKGRTALQLALHFGASDVVSALLDRGARLDVQDHYGVTAYQVAQNRLEDSNCDKKVIKRFIKEYKERHDVSVNGEGKSGSRVSSSSFSTCGADSLDDRAEPGCMPPAAKPRFGSMFALVRKPLAIIGHRGAVRS